MSRVAWIGLPIGLAVAALALAAPPVVPPQRPNVPARNSTSAWINSERLDGVRSTLVTPDGRVLRVTASRIESMPVRLFGPLRLGFLHSAVASDVHVEFDARDPESMDGRPHDAAQGFSARSFGLSHGTLAGLQLNRLDARIIDPLGRLLTVRAQRCEMESPTSLMCFKGRLNFGAREAIFARARFDGTSWQIVEAAPAQPSDSTSRPAPVVRDPNACPAR